MTIVLTTHYIEEAEDMADRVGVIRHGEIILVEDKNTLMREARQEAADAAAARRRSRRCRRRSPRTTSTLGADGSELTYAYDPRGAQDAVVARCWTTCAAPGIRLKDLQTTQSSLEDIFVSLVKEPTHEHAMRSARSTASRWRAPGAP